MFTAETYAAVRRFVFIEGRSSREGARVFGLSRDTVVKMCASGLRVDQSGGAAERQKLGPLVPMIDAMLEVDETAPPKQWRTANHISERLRD